jgi:response regulator RpfG family c-di-GMP phosphodiesterase
MLKASQLLRNSTYSKGAKGTSIGEEGKNCEILVVTTDSATLRALEDGLGEMGYGVAGVRDRDQAEDYLNRRKPIMVISDVDLPADSAYHLFRSIKDNFDTASIPCVFLTNRGESPNQKLGFESGADDYINKPPESTEVKARIVPLLRRGKMGGREQSFGEEKKAPKATPDPKDILSEILSRKKETEQVGQKRARLSSMNFIKKGLTSESQKEGVERKAQEEVEPKREAEVPKEEEKAKREPEAPKKEDEQATQDVGAIYQDSIRAVSEWMDLVSQEGHIDIAEVEKISGSLLEKIDDDELLLLSMMPKAEEEKKDLGHRSVCTAILSLKVGKKMDYPRLELAQLGMVALLHLVGLRKLLEGSGQEAEGSTDEEQQYKKEYPLVGTELLRSSVEKYGGQEDYAWLPDVITQVEEREDGQGVPHGLTGAQIHEYAKIIALVKTYLDFICPLSPAESIVPSEGIKRIIQMQKDVFAPLVVGAFVKELSLFPVGSWVQLSTGETGMVVSSHHSQPLRPTVEVWYDSHGETLSKKKELNLVEVPFVTISKPINEREIVKKI